MDVIFSVGALVLLRKERIRSTQNCRDRDIASLCEEECWNIFIWFCYVTTASSLVVTLRNRYTMSFRRSLWLLFQCVVAQFLITISADISFPFACTVAVWSTVTSGLLFTVLHVNSNVCWWNNNCIPPVVHEYHRPLLHSSLIVIT